MAENTPKSRKSKASANTSESSKSQTPPKSQTSKASQTPAKEPVEPAAPAKAVAAEEAKAVAEEVKAATAESLAQAQTPAAKVEPEPLPKATPIQPKTQAKSEPKPEPKAEPKTTPAAPAATAKPEPKPEPKAEPKTTPAAPAATTKPELQPEPKVVASASVQPPVSEAGVADVPSVAVLSEEATVESAQLNAEVQDIKAQIISIASNLPKNISQFFGDYRRPLTTVIGIIAILITLKVIAGLLDALDDLPLVKSTLELIGMVYSGWFVYRYLLRSETRQELSIKFQTLKDEVLGTKS